MKFFTRFIGWLIFAIPLCSSVVINLNAAEKQNVVLIYIDDLGYGDLGCYDCEDIHTHTSIDLLNREYVSPLPT